MEAYSGNFGSLGLGLNIDPTRRGLVELKLAPLSSLKNPARESTQVVYEFELARLGRKLQQKQYIHIYNNIINIS